MTYRSLAVALLVVFAAVVAGAGIAPAGAAQSDDEECPNVARHDAYRYDDATINATVNGSGTSSELNTETTVAPDTGFVRVSAENPNGYCVRFVVELSPEIVTPASLGTVSSNNDSYDAKWRAVHDFNASETYTEVTFTLPAGAQAEFAPSKARVAVLEWTGTAKNTSAGFFSDFDLPFGGDDPTDEPLNKRTYRLSPDNDTDIITVPLTNQTNGRSIDEYQATYTTPDQDGWRPVGTDSTDPVFKRTVDGGDAVQFQFNQNGTVKFTANPTWSEQASYEWTEYWSGADILDGLLGDDEGD